MNNRSAASGPPPAEQPRILRRPHDGRVIGGGFEFRYEALLMLIALGVAVLPGGRSTRR